MASTADKPLVWLHGEVKTPPFSETGRLEAGFLLRRLQRGEVLSLPHSRPMPSLGVQCHELRINDGNHAWRIMYHVEPDAVVVLEVFSKKTDTTPQHTQDTCRKRLAAYLDAARKERKKR
ncbi:MAG TPA: type II toxin-antitoxin system RelE/ParE family toxin [Vicinamibacterales bacterium]